MCLGSWMQLLWQWCAHLDVSAQCSPVQQNNGRSPYGQNTTSPAMLHSWYGVEDVNYAIQKAFQMWSDVTPWNSDRLTPERLTVWYISHKRLTGTPTLLMAEMEPLPTHMDLQLAVMLTPKDSASLLMTSVTFSFSRETHKSTNLRHILTLWNLNLNIDAIAEILSFKDEFFWWKLPVLSSHLCNWSQESRFSF